MGNIPAAEKFRGVQAIERANAILEYIAEHHNHAKLQDICTGVNLNYNTTYNILRTLRLLGFVQQPINSSEYSLGPKIHYFAQAIEQNTSLTEVATPELQKLSKKYNETCQLGILADNKLVYIGRVDCDRSLRLNSYIGKQMSPHMTSMGKALLAFLPKSHQQMVIDSLSLEPNTPYSITTKEALYEDLALVIKRGYSTDNEENTLGMQCFGAPIFNSHRMPVAAISIVFAKERVQNFPEEQIAEDLIQTALNVSQKLGYDVSP